MIIGKESTNKFLNINEITCNDSFHKITRVFRFKYLGIYIDKRLDFKAHAEYVASRVSSALSFL